MPQLRHGSGTLSPSRGKRVNSRTVAAAATAASDLVGLEDRRRGRAGTARFRPGPAVGSAIGSGLVFGRAHPGAADREDPNFPTDA